VAGRGRRGGGREGGGAISEASLTQIVQVAGVNMSIISNGGIGEHKVQHQAKPSREASILTVSLYKNSEA